MEQTLIIIAAMLALAAIAVAFSFYRRYEAARKDTDDCRQEISGLGTKIARLEASLSASESRCEMIEKSGRDALNTAARERAAEVAALKEQRDKQLKSLQEERANELASAKAQRDKDVAELTDRHGKELADMKERLEKSIADLKEQRDKDMSEAKAERDREVAELKERHEKELNDFKTQRDREIETLNGEREKDRKDAHDLREKELAALKEQFAVLSNRNSEDFKERSGKTIEELLKPVQEKFAEFSETVRTSQKESVARHSMLEQKIKDLDDRSRNVGDEARNLANALLGYSKIQGDFGEMLLSDILTNAGFEEGVEFRTQSVITDEDGHEIKSDSGRRMIPDVTVYYPDNTVVIIDAKLSLTAYYEFMNADTAEQRKKFALQHVDSVRSHISELKTKDYNSYVPEGMRRVDYTIMFIPTEGAFRLMLEQAPTLWQEAKDSGVLIVSQMTLIIVLNMIQMSWNQHRQEKNIANVYSSATTLMSQLRGWLEEYVKVGESLDKAVGAYNASRTKLTGRQGALKKGDSVISNIRKLEDAGLNAPPQRGRLSTRVSATPGTIIPQSILSESKKQDEEE